MMLMITISDVMHPAAGKGFACTCWRLAKAGGWKVPLSLFGAAAYQLPYAQQADNWACMYCVVMQFTSRLPVQHMLYSCACLMVKICRKWMELQTYMPQISRQNST